jgi:hypothetical protein
LKILEIVLHSFCIENLIGFPFSFFQSHLPHALFGDSSTKNLEDIIDFTSEKANVQLPNPHHSPRGHRLGNNAT